MLKGHNSHQIGLDVDATWFRMTKKRPTKSQRESWTATAFVADRKQLLKNWGEEQTTLLSLAAQNPLVNRIFVSPAIKRHLCSANPSAPWLYKVRAWWGHEDHLHARLNCPTGATGSTAPPAELSRQWLRPRVGLVVQRRGRRRMEENLE